MDVPEFTLKEIHLVLEGFRATYGQYHEITAAAPISKTAFTKVQLKVAGMTVDSDEPMFLCRKRMKVAAMMFLSLQLSSTGGCIPSSTTRVRYL